MDISILEIRNAKDLMLDRAWLNGMMPTIDRLLAGDIRTDKMEKRMQAHVTMTSSGNSFLMSDRSDSDSRTAQGEEDYLNVIFLNGPITRNGGACTYGSKQIRNLMMQATADEDCKGHVWIIDTPGGVSNAVSDFRMAVEDAHKRGLLVDGIIDGCCLSLGVYAGQMCDHLYYTSPTDKIGSVGVYAILDVMKNGDVNPTTGETHFEIYDPESYDKNADYRQLSEEGKMDLIKERVKSKGAEFREFVKSRRPGCTDEMLHGKVYDCGEVEGSFVDGQRTMQEVFQEVMGHYYETHKDVKINQSTQLNNINMKEQFPAVFALLGVEEMQMQEGGAFINEELLATLNANIEAAQKEAADAKALAESLTAEKNELTAKVEELTAQAETKEAEHAKAIEDLNAAHAAAIEEKDKAITALEQEKAGLQGEVNAKAESIEAMQTELNGAKESLATAESTLTERDQQIADLNAQVAELQNNPGEGAQAGAAPQNNGSGAEAQGVAISSQYVYDSTKSYEENMKAKKEWEAAHK